MVPKVKPMPKPPVASAPPAMPTPKAPVDRSKNLGKYLHKKRHK